MKPQIALVGMACRYPDAPSPKALWQNVLAQRRAFRLLPSCRLRTADYVSSDRTAADKTYIAQAAVIEGYEFDRRRFRVAGSTYRSADLAHWMALEVAADALADADFSEAEGLPREATGVLLGNTLTGEFSRASGMRLRWPYVRRVVDAALVQENWSADRRGSFFSHLESQYKAPFAPVGEETLAGGLSNTIAGRICNHFNLHGGGYTVDGACASSLLAVAQASSALAAGDLDVAIAGGVDLSLDPFELVGFAKTGALAVDQMRVYDEHSAGFWPGEGCGMLVLMRYEDAVAQGKKIYAVLRGWGVSSDGSGGITRPEVEGQLIAIRRAYQRAGYGIDSVAYIEGHGTGTAVGDATELRTLSKAIRQAAAGRSLESTAIGTIKANIGHTKAAAGVAGVIKAAMAVYHQTLPPTTGCENPHSELTQDQPALRVLAEAATWPTNKPLRAAVSAMGFGGINAHLTMEASIGVSRRHTNGHISGMASSAQDAELFLFNDKDKTGLMRQVNHLLTFANQLSWSDLSDLAAQLIKTPRGGSVRAAIVASTPSDFAKRLRILSSWFQEGRTAELDIRNGVFLGEGDDRRRVGFLFPGQASPVYWSGGALAKQFACVKSFYQQHDLPTQGDPKATELAQPAIAGASCAALRILAQLGVQADVAIGHSVGELAALHWAGVFDEAALVRIATARGKVMAQLAKPGGAMAGIHGDRHRVKALLNGDVVVIAGLNSPRQTVISGQAEAVDVVVERAKSQGLRATLLPVAFAFHSPLMKEAALALGQHLDGVSFQPPQARIVSTVSGRTLPADTNVPEMLVRQLTDPVQFVDAVAQADPDVDLWIEAGPGHVLTGLLDDQLQTPVVALDAGGRSMKGLLNTVGAAFALGVPVNHEALWAGRFTRPFSLDWQPRFFENPCELAPGSNEEENCQALKCVGQSPPAVDPSLASPSVSVPGTVESPLQVMRELVAEHLELPIDTVSAESHLLTDLHMNSIAVGQLVGEAARRLGLAPLDAPTEFASVTVSEVAEALSQLRELGHRPSTESDQQRQPAGVDTWIRSFAVQWVDRSLSDHLETPSAGTWQVMATPNHPWASKLNDVLSKLNTGSGMVCVVGPELDKQSVGLLLEGAQKVLAQKDQTHFVVVHSGGGVPGFAKTLRLESPQIHVCCVDVPLDHPDAMQWVVREAVATRGFVQVRYDRHGNRQCPVLQTLSLDQPTDLPLGQDDVLLVTGGGKGIAAECALDLARQTGVRLLLLGRSQPDTDQELKMNLQRLTQAGAQVMYCAADVTDATAVQSAIDNAQVRWGPVTAIMHAAGINVPQLISSLDLATCCQTLAPKITGLQNVLQAIDPQRLRLLVAFGSIIGRVGLPGEADYALANDRLSELVEQFGVTHPACRCLSVEWSVWSGVGMGQRLGRIELLEREGITPIPTDQGVAALCQLIGQRQVDGSVVVAGRFNKPETIEFEHSELPKGRFLEQPKIHYPGVELVVDVPLSCESDPYVVDHTYDKQHLFPAVMGLEGMTQVAMALMGVEQLPAIKDAQFHRPVVVPSDQPRTIRIAALKQKNGLTRVVLRSEETGFQTDHFQVTFQGQDAAADTDFRPPQIDGLQEVPWLEPQSDLYGSLLFHQGRFQRVEKYRRLRATECWADMATADQTGWFASDLPDTLVLGDPAVRDAAIHAIQACIPHARLLPVSVEQIVLSRIDGTVPTSMYARERYRDGDLFVYDMCLVGSDGSVLEHWQGLCLKKVEPLRTDRPWAIPLLGPYMERAVQERIPQSRVSVAILNGNGPDEISPSDLAVQQVVGSAVAVSRRPDGKPEVSCGKNVSLAKAGGLTIAVADTDRIGCDLEAVSDRSPDVWRDLLGTERMALAERIGREKEEDFSCAATRVWAAAECLKKAGEVASTPVVYRSSDVDGWVMLGAGSLAIATCVARVKSVDQLVVLAVLVRSQTDEEISRRTYVQRHVVSFEETNAVGNVYYTNFLLWQGKCREMFLRDNAVGVLDLIKNGLSLVTTRCGCEYFAELWAFDEIEIRMVLEAMERNLIDLGFEYWRIKDGKEELVARGQQQIACTLADGTRTIPDTIRTALEQYTS